MGDLELVMVVEDGEDEREDREESVDFWEAPRTTATAFSSFAPKQSIEEE